MRKAIAALGLSLILGAVTPLTVGHWGSPNGFGDEGKPLPGVITDGIAGTVVGHTTPAVIGTNGNVLEAKGVTVCDLEVGVGPTGALDPGREEEIDEQQTPRGVVPDNTWDDGGVGGACHVATYTVDEWNTVGCGEADDQSEARALPLGPPAAFLGAGCDVGTAFPLDLSPGGGVLAAGCGGAQLARETGPTVFCTSHEAGWTSRPPFFSCEPDGLVDFLIYDYATVYSGPPVPTKTEALGVFAGVPNCESSLGQAAVFVFQSVDPTGLIVSYPSTHVWTV